MQRAAQQVLAADASTACFSWLNCSIILCANRSARLKSGVRLLVEYLRLKDLIEVIVWIVGAGSLAFAADIYYLSKKRLNFAVIISCTERFQKIMAQLKSTDEERRRAVKQYFDLCHEQLFYFRHQYLPDEIIDEWLDGMIYYLPRFVGSNNVNRNPDYLREIEDLNLPEEYPKLKEVLSVEQAYEVTDKTQRKELVLKVVKESRNRVMRRSLISHSTRRIDSIPHIASTRRR